MIIKEFTIADHDSAAELWHSVKGVCNCDKCTFLDSKENIAKFLTRNPGMSFAAFDGGLMTGVVLCGHDGRTGIIYRLTVAESHHRKGIGGKLVEKAVEALKKEGIINVKAFVLNDNPSGHAFWEQVGFKENTVAMTRYKEIR
ncbi:MAG: GNAT family N-acetyltransferase [Oscillospiraceae bacterium]|nr:GNAT family N-acetyltransferase [Oscillospiraceae bacterium]